MAEDSAETIAINNIIISKKNAVTRIFFFFILSSLFSIGHGYFHNQTCAKRKRPISGFFRKIFRFSLAFTFEFLCGSPPIREMLVFGFFAHTIEFDAVGFIFMLFANRLYQYKIIKNLDSYFG